jgi:hypothetical protein
MRRARVEVAENTKNVAAVERSGKLREAPASPSRNRLHEGSIHDRVDSQSFAMTGYRFIWAAKSATLERLGLLQDRIA